MAIQSFGQLSTLAKVNKVAIKFGAQLILAEPLNLKEINEAIIWHLAATDSGGRKWRNCQLLKIVGDFSLAILKNLFKFK